MTSEVGRVLLVLPLSEIKKIPPSGRQSVTASRISDAVEQTYAGEATASRKRRASSALR